MRRVPLIAAGLLLAAAVLSVPGPVAAAGLTAVTGFGSNPGNLAMYEYVPASLPANPPVVVAGGQRAVRHPGGPAYATGLSGGGAMTAVLLAAYPEVFAGGSVVAGLPPAARPTWPRRTRA